MARGPFTEPIVLTAEERDQLTRFARSRTLPHGLARRATIVLKAADGMKNLAIAEAAGVHHQTVYRWRKRFTEKRIEGLYDELRPGRPRTVTDDKVVELVNRTLQTKPVGRSHWDSRSLGAECGVSKDTVQRVWRAFGLKPHLVRDFSRSTDPFFPEKVRDVVGLYLDPPENAIVYAVDEKSQCQALERMQPILNMGLGYLEGITHNYIRHGTTTLFAALDIATGQVLARCMPKHRHQEFLRFLRLIDRNVPQELAVHLVMDNYATHKHHKVRLWLAQHPRFTVHFTPTYSSWLNQAEIWFGLITRQTIRRGSFSSVGDLISKIDEFVEAYNPEAQPFVWTATADSIIEKLTRLCENLLGNTDAEIRET